MLKLVASTLFLAGALSAADPVISQKRLDALGDHWRHVLQLDDWRVTVQAVGIDQLPEGTAGAAEREARYQVIHVYVLKPSDYKEMARRGGLRLKSGKAISRDIEDTVVHELVHLRLQAFRQELLRAAEMDDLDKAVEVERAAEEVVVVRLTTALLSHNKP